MTIRWRVLVLVATLAISVWESTSAHGQSVDAPIDAGDVTLVDPGREEIREGQGTTRFAVELPSMATCPGDSRHDQWRVMTFVVPAHLDPGQLTYNSIGPEGDGLYALYGLDTNPIVEVLTAPNEGPGEPGLILGLPAASFEIFPPGTLPDGRYKLGVACTYFDDTAVYWDTKIDVVRDETDQPAEMRWSVVSTGSARPTDSATGDGGSSSSIAAIFVVLLAVLGVALFFTTRSRRRVVAPKEISP